MRLRCIYTLIFILVPIFLYSNSATLRWSPNPAGENVIGYYIYRTSMPGVYDYTMPLNSTPSNSLEISSGKQIYIDNTLPNDKVYCYVLKATNSAGVYSPNSNEVCASPLAPSPPAGLILSDVTTVYKVTTPENQTATLTIEMKYDSK